MRHFQEAKSELFQICRMSHASQCQPVIDFIQFWRALAHRQHENARIIRQRDDGAALGKLFIEVVAPIANRFYPLIGLFIHRSALRSTKITAESQTPRRIGIRWLRSFASAGLPAEYAHRLE